MRFITIFLTIVLVLIQYPLWLGKGGWLRVWDLDKQVKALEQKNETMRVYNAKMDSEVQDLRSGKEAIEEHARSELGMIKEGEIFIQFLDAKSGGAAQQAVAPKPEKRK